MHVCLRTVQSLLAAAFAASGVLRTTKSHERLSPQLSRVSDVPAAVVRLIGLAEFTAPLGYRLNAILLIPAAIVT